jgi:hypothetical protein
MIFGKTVAITPFTKADGLGTRLHAMQLSVKFNSKFSGLLCAMQRSAEETYLREYICEIEKEFENIVG